MASTKEIELERMTANKKILYGPPKHQYLNQLHCANLANPATPISSCFYLRRYDESSRDYQICCCCVC